MKNIQLFVPTYNIDECLAEIRECLEIGWTGIGFKTNRFEDAWKNYTGLSNAHFLNSNTAGLHLALKLFKEEFKWNDSDEVITTPLTFISTNHAILYERLHPVFADTDDTLCLDPESIEKRITPKTRAVMYVGMGGNAGRLNDVIDICKTHGLKLILDAAHMAGTVFNNKHIGHGIDCTVFSYQAVKNLPTGDSGMICFTENEFDTKARMLSWLGISKDTYSRAKGNYKWLYEVEYVGLKAHGNSIMAAIGLVQIRYMNRDNEKRREIAQKYDQYFYGISDLKLIEHLDNCISSRHLYQIRVPENLRDEMIVYLNSKNIFPGVHYRSNTEYKMYKYALGTCPEAEKVSREIISLPMHLRLTDDDVQYVSETLLNYIKENH
ncbi:MAG: DegT/DnrJ/EryC1/StrS family aminotransferase [Bacteroidetes bacterium]|nr:DegT/DnrJ/EryC1/StrS family aminotransferase [Bacteroidota bacterium]